MPDIVKKFSDIGPMIYRNFQVLPFLIENGRNVLSCGIHEEEKKIVTPQMQKELSDGLSEKNVCATFIEKNSSIYFMAIQLDAEHVLLLGPASSTELSILERHEFCNAYGLLDMAFPIPVIFYGRQQDMLQLIFYTFLGKPMPEGSNFRKDEAETANSQKELDMVDYRRFKYEEEHKHFPYEVELDYYNSIKSGIAGEQDMGRQYTEQELFEGIGVLSAVGLDKQFEYMAVTMITVAARAAIDGGVPPQEAYEVSDLLLQDCSKCRNNREYVRLIEAANKRFISKVKEYKSRQNEDPDIERCKDYIASHLFAKLTVEEIAVSLHISYTYLSVKFKKKTGMGISEYIRKEKLNAVKNYLTYSDASIGEISERMAFISPSRMSEQFRKEYGISPGEYRRLYRRDAFTGR